MKSLKSGLFLFILFSLFGRAFSTKSQEEFKNPIKKFESSKLNALQKKLNNLPIMLFAEKTDNFENLIFRKSNDKIFYYSLFITIFGVLAGAFSQKYLSRIVKVENPFFYGIISGTFCMAGSIYFFSRNISISSSLNLIISSLNKIDKIILKATKNLFNKNKKEKDEIKIFIEGLSVPLEKIKSLASRIFNIINLNASKTREIEKYNTQYLCKLLEFLETYNLVQDLLNKSLKD